ncbi:hypothetical protein LKD81_16815 [Lachnospiraceae bacterium CLA-AA-H215]|uniref:Uncharacterized protein n=1 Tax=Hominifimenecus microfluidus TaxID=2885348 RepID=A0AAE3JI42_9FIRM|nr:hypothetical protein [Hominifimenecus microfluidus]MCC2232631.1 hypothetical protein [Hominifimenecus microfluidus]
MIRVTIPGRFAGMNEFISANRTGKGNWNKANTMKQQDQSTLIASLRPVLRQKGIRYPIYIRYHFYEPSARRDKDNISGYFHKIFQDALVVGGWLPDDSWDYITGFSDAFSVDKENPHIEIDIVEVGEHER